MYAAITFPMSDPQLKIVFFADTHLGFDYPIRPKINIRRRGEDFFNNYHKILQYAEKTKPDFLLHGGDFFFRSKVSQPIVDLSYQPLFDFVNKTNIPIYIVPGNHERSSLPQSIYLAHPSINIFNRARSFVFEKNDFKVSLYGFPFFRGDIRGEFKNLILQSGWNDSEASMRLIVVHQAIDGAQVGPGNYTFRNREDVIDINDIPGNATAILSGHIHRRQVLYSGKVPVIYPGSIERTSFAEKDESKGFYELTFRNDGNIWFLDKLKFLKLPARPMTDIYLDADTELSRLQKRLIQDCAGLPENSIVRIRTKNKHSPEALKLSAAQIRDLLPSEFSIQFGREFFTEVENH